MAAACPCAGGPAVGLRPAGFLDRAGPSPAAVAPRRVPVRSLAADGSRGRALARSSPSTSSPEPPTCLAAPLAAPVVAAAPVPLSLRRSPCRVPAVCATKGPLFQEVASSQQSTDHLTVGDYMTTRLITVKASTPIDDALELLVEHRITGLPVLDDDGRLVGVVSDYDLLAIDAILGDIIPPQSSGALFPEAGSSWKAFKEIQKLFEKTKGKLIGDVMTPHPMTVRASTNLDEAARILLSTKFRRLPVLDSEGRLVGLLTRGNVVKAALELKHQGEGKSV